MSELRTPTTRTRAAFRMHGARALLAGALAIALASAPATAFAWRSPSDKVGGTPLAKGAVPAAAAPDIDAAAGILVSSDGRVLWSRGENERRAMASTTKMMTALLAIEHGHLNDMVTVSKTAASAPYGTGLRPGERIRAGRLLELMLVASSNDAAYAMGEHIGGGSMPRFVGMMNARARGLGLKQTHFINPHGLDAPGHYSTPADLAKLARTVMAKPVFRRIVAQRKVGLPGYPGRPARIIKSTDKLLGAYPGLRGGKTGTTGDAGYCFVSSASRNGITLTAVILGARSGAGRFAQTRRLLDWGFRNLRVRKLSSAGESAGEVPVAANPARKVPVRLGKSVSARVFALDGKVSREASLTAGAALPVLEGQPLGEVRLVQGGRVLASVPAIAATSTISVEETIGSVPVTDFVDRSVVIRTAPGAPVPPALDPRVPVKRHVDVHASVAAPVVAGQRLGEITYTQGSKVVARVPVVAAQSVAAPGFFSDVLIALARGWRTLLGEPTTARLRIVGSS